jgi:hypothetical protein
VELALEAQKRDGDKDQVVKGVREVQEQEGEGGDETGDGVEEEEAESEQNVMKGKECVRGFKRTRRETLRGVENVMGVCKQEKEQTDKEQLRALPLEEEPSKPHVMQFPREKRTDWIEREADS